MGGESFPFLFVVVRCVLRLLFRDAVSTRLSFAVGEGNGRERERGPKAGRLVGGDGDRRREEGEGEAGDEVLVMLCCCGVLRVVRGAFSVPFSPPAQS